MADKNKGISETFGKYTDSGKGRSGKIDGPKNITSDMWTPISAGHKEEGKAVKTGKAPQKKAAPQKKTPSGKETQKQQDFISEGRKKEERLQGQEKRH